MDVVLVFSKLGTHKSALWLAILQIQEQSCLKYYTGGQLGFKRTDRAKARRTSEANNNLGTQRPIRLEGVQNP